MEKFYFYYAHLMEYYQRIEDDLEKLYCQACGKSAVEGFEDVEKDPISVIIRKLKTVQRQVNIIKLSDDELKRVEIMCKNRNYWVHSCFIEFSLEERIKDHKADGIVQKLIASFQEAESIMEMLNE